MVESSGIPLFKMVVVGAQQSGKTSIINSYLKKSFNSKVKPSTSATESSVKVDLHAVNSKVEFWIFDLPGSE